MPPNFYYFFLVLKSFYIRALPVEDAALHDLQLQSVQRPTDSEAVRPHSPTVWTCTHQDNGRAGIYNGLNNFCGEVI